MQLDGAYHPITITLQDGTIERSGTTAHIEVLGTYTALGVLLRACRAFGLPDSAWSPNPTMFLEMSQTGQRLANGLLLCETEVCENDLLTLRSIEER